MVSSSSGGLNCNGIGVEFLDESVNGDSVGFTMNGGKCWVWKLGHWVGSSRHVGSCGGLVGARDERCWIFGTCGGLVGVRDDRVGALSAG